MNAANLTSSPKAQSDDAARLVARKVWRELGPGPWRTENEHNVVADEMLRAIIAAAGIYEGDFAGAAVRRNLLVQTGAISGVRHADGSITWTRTHTFPEPPEDALSWTDRENARLQKQHERNLAEMKREGQAIAKASEVLDAPDQARFERRLWKAGASPDQIRAIVRAEIEAAFERRFAAHVNAGDGPQEAGSENE